MSGKIFTPVNQVRFTNVAVVRLKRGGKRFEIACYKNKVGEYRKKITTDLDEVLQSRMIFSNISKGIAANKGELKKAFNTTDEDKIILMILDKGELQVSGEEREREFDTLFKDIATIVAEKCVNPETGRPLTVGLVQKAMKEIHYSVNPAKSAKSQALQVIKLLAQKEDFPIARAPMRLKFLIPVVDGREVKEKLTPLLKEVELEEWGEENLEMIVLIDPSNYRPVDQIVRKDTKGKGNIELLSMSVHQEGDEKIE